MNESARLERRALCVRFVGTQLSNVIQCETGRITRGGDFVRKAFIPSASHFRSFAIRKRDVFAKKCIDHELVRRTNLRRFGRQVVRTSRNVRIGRQSMRDDALT